MSSKLDVFGGMFSSEKAEIPTGGGPRGLCGPFEIKHYQVVYSDGVDVREKYWRDQNVPLPDVTRETSSGGFWFYYKTRADAEEACSPVGARYPSARIRFVCPTNEIINWMTPESASNWGDTIEREISVVSPHSRKWGDVVAFHLIFVPSLVQAMARMMKRNGALPEWEDGNYIDFTPLGIAHMNERNALENGEASPFDDAFQAEWVGSSGDYHSSALAVARTSLWRSLGEEDPSRYLPKANGGRLEVTTDAMNMAVQLVTHDLVDGFVLYDSVPNPVTDAVTNEGKRFTIPVILEIFRNEEEAREFLGMTDNSGKPALPVDWADVGEEAFREELKKLKGQYSSPDEVKKPDLINLSITKGDLERWWDAV